MKKLGVRLALAGLAAAVVVGAFGLTLAGKSASAEPAARLTVFTGTATVSHAGASLAGRTGDTLGDGDGLATSSDGFAALTFADGSELRLDVSSNITVHIAAVSGGGLAVAIRQTAGTTFSSVAALVGGATYAVQGPNGSTAEVRGTDFLVTVGLDDAGRMADEIDVLAGEVEVHASGAAALVATGQSTHATRLAAPDPPKPVSDAVRRSPFVTFNQAISAASGTKPVAVAVSTLSQGQSAPSSEVAASGNADLTFTLSWPGSTFKLTVIDPSGKVYQEVQSATSPIVIVVPAAAAGAWHYQVTDVASSPKEPYATAVGHGAPRPRPSPPAFEPAVCQASGKPGETVSIGLHVSGAQVTVEPAPPGVEVHENADGATVTVAIRRQRPPAEIAFHVVATASGARSSILCKVEVERVAPRPAPSPSRSAFPTTPTRATGARSTASPSPRPS